MDNENDDYFVPDFSEDQGQEETKIEVLKSKEQENNETLVRLGNNKAIVIPPPDLDIDVPQIKEKVILDLAPPEPGLSIKLRTERIIRGRNHGIRTSRRWRQMSGDEKRNFLAVDFEEALIYLKAVRQGMLIENDEYESEITEERREELRKSDRKYKSTRNLVIEGTKEKKADRKQSIDKLAKTLGLDIDINELIKESQERMKNKS